MTPIKLMAFHPDFKKLLLVAAIDFRNGLLTFVSDGVGKYRLSEVKIIRFTGLRDEKKTEIYEGDQIKFEYEEDLSEGTRFGTVVWDDDGYWAVDIEEEGFITAIFNDKISDILVLRRSEGGD